MFLLPSVRLQVKYTINLGSETTKDLGYLGTSEAPDGDSIKTQLHIDTYYSISPTNDNSLIRKLDLGETAVYYIYEYLLKELDNPDEPNIKDILDIKFQNGKIPSLQELSRRSMHPEELDRFDETYDTPLKSGGKKQTRRVKKRKRRSSKAWLNIYNTLHYQFFILL